MKHAGPATLLVLAPLLDRLRQMPALKERTPGSFYRKSQAFLHFHEDPAGNFADVKLGGKDFTRLPVDTGEQQARLLALVAQQLAGG